MKTKLLFNFFLLTNMFLIAQNVNIPDANFKSYLLGNSSINTNGDTEIQISEATSFSGSFNAIGLGITDLTGIEAFTSLGAFSAASNALTSVDLSQNTSLVEVRLPDNQLTSIDVSNLPNLIFLQLSNNPITSLDLTNNPNLETIICNNAQLSSISLNNPILTQLELGGNQLTSVDTSSLPQLFEVFLQNNQLTNIDLSANSNLFTIRLDSNNLSSCNVANGNNANISLANFFFNPNLACIQVDNGFTPFVSSSGAWLADATASFNSNCNLSIDQFNKIEAKIFPNPVLDILNIDSNYAPNSIEIYSVLGKEMISVKNTQTVDVAKLKSGAYFIKVSSDNGSFTKRFIKH
ncbi:MAG: hypothetical protein Wins2KO_29120 [Winogradskyella sp.]